MRFSPLSQSKTVLILIFILLGFFAWLNRSIQDDAFIALRYADNWVSGYGLFWQMGSQVEGYNSLLWTVFLALPLLLHLDPVLFIQLLGIGFFIITLFFVYQFTYYLFYSYYLALIAILFLGTHQTFISYATSGLETSLQTAVLTAMTYWVLRLIPNDWTPLNLVGLSLLFSLAITIRFDSAVFIFILLAILIFSIWRRKLLLKQRIIALICLITPLILVIFCRFSWRLFYYSDLLPNTYYARVSLIPVSSLLKQGLAYCHDFSMSYWLFPFLFLFIAALPRLFSLKQLRIFTLCMIITFWCLYLIELGGDFKEFRLFVPILPLIIILIIWLLFEFIQQSAVRWALLGLLFTGSVHHALTFQGTPHIKPIYELRKTTEQWIRVGNVFKDTFSPGSITIATSAIGAIPYYSRLETVDMLGINDRWVAKNGTVFRKDSFAQRSMTLNQLKAKQVNLVLGYPQITPIKQPFAESFGSFGQFLKAVRIPSESTHTVETQLLEIPLENGLKITVLYLQPTPYLDDLIRQFNWNVFSM